MTLNPPPLEALRARFGERLSTAPAVLEAHGRDESRAEAGLPHAVLFAADEADVVALLRLAHGHRFAVIPYGAGSSLEGQLIPVRGGVSLDLSGMRGVLDIRPASFQARVQSGLPYPELNRQLRSQGLFFPVDPGAEATLGGMAATNASGTGAVRYGTMRDNVLAMRAVLPGGEVLRLGAAARKSSAGYDLRGLFVGSEGTLGVITELTVRLHPLPAHLAALRLTFGSILDAAGAAAAVMGAGLSPERLELIDGERIAAINAYLGRDYPALPTLWVELAAPSPAALEGVVQAAAGLCRDLGAHSVEHATTPAERRELWEARHKAYYAITAQHPGHAFLTTDLCVPLEHLPGAVEHAQALAHREGLDIAILGHVGDGNFHANFHAHPDDAATWVRIHAVYDRMVERALGVGGTCTGEHGVGLHKVRHLAREHGDSLPAMRAVKAAFDPHGIMNPGKLWEDAS